MIFLKEKAALDTMRGRRRQSPMALLALSLVLLTGCASGFVTVSPRIPVTYEKLGHAEGSACGTISFRMAREIMPYQ